MVDKSLSFIQFLRMSDIKTVCKLSASVHHVHRYVPVIVVHNYRGLCESHLVDRLHFNWQYRYGEVVPLS